MKRLIISFIVSTSILYTYAQKSYVTVYCCQNDYSKAVCLSGDIPSSMLNTYYYSDLSSKPLNMYFVIGDVLNLLAGNGFEVDQMNSVVNDTDGKIYTTYLLSKASDVSGQSTKIRIVKTNDTDDADVTEVARYNLQGIPVKESDKGLQIIVFSNFTTKTVIVQ